VKKKKMNTKKTISVAMAAIMMLSIFAIAPVWAPGTESPATKTTIGDVPSYVEDKCELPDDDSGTDGTQIASVMGTDKTVTKCAVVCDANDKDDISTVDAHVFYPDGTTKDAETLEVCTDGECVDCSFTVGENCKVYYETFILKPTDPPGFYTVAIWAAGGGTKSAIVKGADRLVDNQNTDGGWDWEEDDDPATGSTTNTIGVTAKGLYYAYKLTEDEDYMTAMENAVGYISAHPPTHNDDKSMTDAEKNSGCWQNKDVLFLAELALLTNDDATAQLARDRYDAFVTEAGGPAGLVTYYMSYRSGAHGILPWDVGDWILASYELAELYPGQGYLAKGNSMADELKTQVIVTDWFKLSDNTENNYYLGLSGVIESFSTTSKYPTELSTTKDNLKAGQNADGSWPDEDPEGAAQVTAYALMSLEMSGDRDLASAGAKWLVANQKAEGYWEDTENNEVTSEGIWAIAMLIMEQNRFEYLELLALDIDTTTINFGAVQPGITTTVTGDEDMVTTGAPTVKNVGNVEIDVDISGEDMIGAAHSDTIPVGSIDDQFDTLGWTALSTTASSRDVNLASEATESLSCRLTPPIGTTADSYTGDITVTAIAS
jgi:hypothetical protein